MKKIITMACVIGAFSFAANANTDKTNFYLTGKLGTSVMQLTSPKYSQFDRADASNNEYYTGGSSNSAVFGGGLAIGYDLLELTHHPVRLELDLVARGGISSDYNLFKIDTAAESSTDDATNKVSLNTVMLNVYYDFINQSAFTPYISGGIGYASIKHKTTVTNIWNEKVSGYSEVNKSDFSKTTNTIAWSLGVGVNYTINDDFVVDLGYRYLDAGLSDSTYRDGDTTDVSKVKVKTNDVMLGLTYRF